MKVWVLPKISQPWSFNKGWMCVFASESKLVNKEFHFWPDIGISAIFLAIFARYWDMHDIKVHGKWYTNHLTLKMISPSNFTLLADSISSMKLPIPLSSWDWFYQYRRAMVSVSQRCKSQSNCAVLRQRQKIMWYRPSIVDSLGRDLGSNQWLVKA